MREIKKRPLALKDLTGIWHYTYERWSEEQATQYLRSIDATLQRLAAHPELGRSIEFIRPGYRAIQVGRHIVFYTFDETTISVRRVLHERMDLTKHL